MHIGHVALRVPDLEASVSHAVGVLGLGETPCTLEGTRLLTANAKHHELQLIEASEAAFDHVGLELAPGELDELHARVVESGARVLSEEPQEPGLDEAIRVEGPAGIVFELYSGMARAEPGIADLIGAHALKLGHLTFTLRESSAVLSFLTEVLGFRVSDHVAPAHWLRCDADHHGIALVEGFAQDRLHHYAFELAGWSGMLRYLDGLALRRERLLYGPGRHGPGMNIFTYTVDPAAGVLEAYADLQRIDDEQAYVPIDWQAVPHEENLWGPPAPADFSDFGLAIPAPSTKEST